MFGLYGVTALLLVGVATVVVTATARPGKRRMMAIIALFGAGVVLVLRGVGLEMVLPANIGGVRQQVGPLETHWNQILWDPWFVLGGCLFIASSIEAMRRPSAGRPR